MSEDRWELNERVKILTSKLPGDDRWITGTVSYITNKKICVRYDNYWADCIGTLYEWIDESSKIQTFQQEAIIYITANTDTKSFESTSIDFKCHETNKEYTVRWSCCGKRLRIKLYDLETNHCEFIMPTLRIHHIYPNMHTLDKKNNLLYILDDKGRFVTFNLNDKAWRRWANEYAVAVLIPHPVNALHIITGNKHKKYDYNQQKYVDIGSIIGQTDIHRIINNSLFYVKSVNKLFLFRRDGDYNIYYCDIIGYGQTVYEWKPFPIKIPNGSSHVVLCYDHIFLLYYGKDIYCLDVLHEKCCISNKKTPRIMKTSGNMMEDDEMLHYVDMDRAGFHIKWSLNGIVPDEIESVYRILIWGFIKEEEERMDINIPFDLKKIIVAFYPSHFNKY